MKDLKIRVSAGTTLEQTFPVRDGGSATVGSFYAEEMESPLYSGDTGYSSHFRDSYLFEHRIMLC